jgi:hypothetical protein
VIKVYSVTSSCIYEHEKEQRLISVTYSHVFTSTRNNLGNLFSCIYENAKEQRLSSVLVSFLHKLETKLNYACKLLT